MKTNSNSKYTFSSRTTALLAADAALTAPAIATAAAKLKESQEKAAAEKAELILKNGDKMLQAYVANLKEYRKLEKAAKASLVKFDAAFAEFTKHGDVDRLAKETEISAQRFLAPVY